MIKFEDLVINESINVFEIPEDSKIVCPSFDGPLYCNFRRPLVLNYVFKTAILFLRVEFSKNPTPESEASSAITGSFTLLFHSFVPLHSVNVITTRLYANIVRLICSCTRTIT